MYKGLKRVPEGGLEQGLSRALKVANGEGIYMCVFEVKKRLAVAVLVLCGQFSSSTYERRLTIL